MLRLALAIVVLGAVAAAGMETGWSPADDAAAQEWTRARRARRADGDTETFFTPGSLTKQPVVQAAEDKPVLCMDGTPAVYYISRNANSKKWVVQLQEGGFCISPADCQARAQTDLGSSANLPDSFRGNFVTRDAPANPEFNGWNRVFVPYCSGDIFVGTRRSEEFGGLNFYGYNIVEAVIVELQAEIANGDGLLFGGNSAGGIGTTQWIDRIAEDFFPDIHVDGFVNGAFFNDFPFIQQDIPWHTGPPYSFPDSQMGKLAAGLSNVYGAKVDESCSEAFTAQGMTIGACIVGSFAVDYISTPTFFIWSRWDTNQLSRTQIFPEQLPVLPAEFAGPVRAYLQAFGDYTAATIAKIAAKPDFGYWFASCFNHIYLLDGEDAAAEVNGVTAYAALVNWYTGTGPKESYQLSENFGSDGSMCNPTCCMSPGSICPACKAYSDEETWQHDMLLWSVDMAKWTAARDATCGDA